ncbi:type IV pilin protein [Ideonella sp. DXS22W]|uniref:Type IV pilin protein n=1 Tax=Pseudaquabacterium inlustre TaxID=2984192 RepID=A0ABU9CGZ7_9BURK
MSWVRAHIRHRRGFTLVELAIVLAVIALLAAVAWPSYNASVRKSRRVDAYEAVLRIQQAQERWRGLQPSYTAALSDLSQSANSPAGYYTLALSAASETAYTITATAVSGRSQASDTGCTALTVTVTRGQAVNGQPDCWSR